MRRLVSISVFGSLGLLAAVAAFVGCGSGGVDGGGGGEGGLGSGGGALLGPPRTKLLELGIAPASLTTKVAVLEGGPVVAGSGASGLLVARFDAELQLLWAKSVEGSIEPSELAVDGRGRILVLTGQSGSPEQLIRLNEDGSLDRAIESSTSNGISGFALADDGLILSDSTLLDEDFEIVGRGNARGEKVARATDGFVFLSARELGNGGRQSGILLRKTDPSGLLEWQSFASPVAANYGALGVRELPNGNYLAAVAGDTRPGHALFVGVFSPEGSLVAANDPDFSVTDDEGNFAPLQFGGAIALSGEGATSYASLIANSGALGVDSRQQIVVELDATATVRGALLRGGGSAASGGTLFVFGGLGTLYSTNTFESDCVPSPDFGQDTTPPFEEFTEASAVTPTVSTAAFSPYVPTLIDVSLTPTEVCE